jgi:hypothetical protein
MPSSVATTVSSPAPARGARLVVIVLITWFGLATWLAASGRLLLLPPIAFPVMVWGAFGACFALYKSVSSVRRALSRVPLIAPVAFHAIVRTGYGIGILVEGARGQLPASFANVAGPGDIAVGVLALSALVVMRRPSERARRLLFVWNAFGLLDMVVVVVAAQRVVLFGEGPRAFQAMAQFPYAWLPMFVVPLVIGSHVWLFARLRRTG